MIVTTRLMPYDDWWSFVQSQSTPRYSFANLHDFAMEVMDRRKFFQSARQHQSCLPRRRKTVTRERPEIASTQLVFAVGLPSALTIYLGWLKTSKNVPLTPFSGRGASHKRPNQHAGSPVPLDVE